MAVSSGKTGMAFSSPKSLRGDCLLKNLRALTGAIEAARPVVIAPSLINEDGFGGYTLDHEGRADPMYISPEMFWSGKNTPAGLVYALGLMLYEAHNYALPPFADDGSDDSLITALRRRMSGETPPPPRDADDALCDVILSAIQFSGEARLQTPEELIRELETALRAGREFIPIGFGGFDRPAEQLSECERLMAELLGAGLT